jgi:formylmethanofuran:tetrahydromethanopterin formyltransferase
VIISVPNGIVATFSGGVTQTSANNGTNKVYTITATSTGSETVTFSI